RRRGAGANRGRWPRTRRSRARPASPRRDRRAHRRGAGAGRVEGAGREHARLRLDASGEPAAEELVPAGESGEPAAEELALAGPRATATTTARSWRWPLPSVVEPGARPASHDRLDTGERSGAFYPRDARDHFRGSLLVRRWLLLRVEGRLGPGLRL